MRAAADDADPVVSRAQAAPDALLRNLVHDCGEAALTLPVVPGMDAARRGRPGAPLHVNHSARTTSPRGATRRPTPRWGVGVLTLSRTWP